MSADKEKLELFDEISLGFISFRKWLVSHRPGAFDP